MRYSSIVVGAGPGGLAAVVALLDHGQGDVVWVDRDFKGGRLNGMYREVSSNTKVGIYIDAIESSKTCREIIKDTPEPNALTRLKEINRDETVELSLAGDLIMMLIDHLGSDKRVKMIESSVEELHHESGMSTGQWTARLRSGENVCAERVILYLDKVLRKSLIPELFGLPPSTSPSTAPTAPIKSAKRFNVGIIGNSHSGILALWNLYETLPSSHFSTLYLFERHPIIYAEYREDGIVHDNRGLKGATADWSRDMLERTNPGQGRIKRIRIDEVSSPQSDADTREGRDAEEEAYEKWLSKCDYLIYAIGYVRNEIPKVYIDKQRIDETMEFDMHTSGFHIPSKYSIPTDKSSEKGANGLDIESGKIEEQTQKGEAVLGLYGCGIAFPEEVSDPEGNLETAVGVAKFFKFAERVSADVWVK